MQILYEEADTRAIDPDITRVSERGSDLNKVKSNKHVGFFSASKAEQQKDELKSRILPFEKHLVPARGLSPLNSTQKRLGMISTGTVP